MINWASDFPASTATSFLGKSSELASLADKAKDGDTFYAVDTKEFYVFYDNEWFLM